VHLTLDLPPYRDEDYDVRASCFWLVWLDLTARQYRLSGQQYHSMTHITISDARL